MNPNKQISFDDAWRDFLIIRGIFYHVQINVSLDSNHRISGVNLISPLARRNIDGEEYFCDESSASIPLAYSVKKLVLPEIQEKIIEPLFVEQLTKTSKIASSTYVGKRRKLRRKIEARLGCSIRSEVRRLISEKSYWETLFSLHQILEHRLRKMLMYKSMDIDSSNSQIFVDSLKEKICEDIKTFKHLTNIAFLAGAIDEETRNKIICFNEERGDIAHKLLKMKISPRLLKNLCSRGLELTDTLENHFSKIVPKPDCIEMRKFEIIATRKPKK